MKKYLAFILTLFSVVVFAQENMIIEKVVANVGDEIVLLSEVEEQRSLALSQKGEVPEGVRCLILDNIMAQKLLVNQAKLDSVEVSEVEVETQLNARIEQILAYMGGDVKQFEDYYGQTVNEVKESFREDLKSQLLSERMRAQVMQSVTVTPAEVIAFFNEIPEDSLPYFNSEVEIGEIVINPEVNEVERQKALDKLTMIKEEIVNGVTTFEDAAKKFSADPGSGRIGGDLGWSKRGKFVPEFEAAAYNLDPGEMSEPVESQFGFHLIELIERRGNSIHTRHILIKPEITDADLSYAENKLDSVRQLIVDDSTTFSIAVKKFGFDEVQSYNNDGRMVNPNSGNTFFEIADLDPDIYFTIDTMEVGQFSAPFAFQGPTGETMYRIIQLQSRTEPHRASLAKDYSKIQKAATESKRAEILNDWVNKTVNSTFVRIDNLFVGCPNLEKWSEKDRIVQP